MSLQMSCDSDILIIVPEGQRQNGNTVRVEVGVDAWKWGFT